MGNCASCQNKYERNLDRERSKSSRELNVCITEWERGNFFNNVIEWKKYSNQFQVVIIWGNQYFNFYQ